MNNVQRLTLLIVSMIAVGCFAETFVDEKPQRRMNLGQLRQDIIHEMAQLIEKQSVLIQKAAQVQQSLCAHVRAYAESEKNGFVSHAAVSELKKMLKTLQNETVRTDKDLVALTQLIAELKGLERH